VSTRRSTSLEKGLVLLQELAAAGSSLAVSELAASAGLNRSTGYRLCDALESAGWLHTVSDGPAALRRVNLGPQAFGLAVLIASKYDPESRLQPIMDELARKVSETVHAGILDDTTIIHVARAVPESGLHMAMEVGAREVAHITSLGKALLATLDRDEVLRRYPSERLAVPTPRSIATRTELLAELDRVVERGYAHDDEESSSGVKCLGAPIFDTGGKALFAISVTAIPQHLEGERLGAVANALREAAASATAAFAGEAPAGFGPR